MNVHRTRPARGRLALLWIFLVAILAAPACAQSSSGSQSRQGAASTTSSAEARDSAQARASRARVKGAESAPVTIVEVSDFQCPYCRRFTQEAYKQIDSAYVRTGKVKFVFISYPLPSHPQSWDAAEAAFCAGAQGKFWPMHDRLFATQPEWSGQGSGVARFARYASELKLDMAAYDRCVRDDEMASLIVNDATQAAQAGINGTPAFILNGQKSISGAAPFEEFRQAIDPLLAGAPAAPAPAAPAGAPKP